MEIPRTTKTRVHFQDGMWESMVFGKIILGAERATTVSSSEWELGHYRWHKAPQTPTEQRGWVVEHASVEWWIASWAPHTKCPIQYSERQRGWCQVKQAKKAEGHKRDVWRKMSWSRTGTLRGIEKKNVARGRETWGNTHTHSCRFETISLHPVPPALNCFEISLLRFQESQYVDGIPY